MNSNPAPHRHLLPDEIQHIIEQLGLEPLPVEGILFRQTWRLDDGDRIVGTAIYGAMTDEPDSFSAMHRLTDTEIWHFYAGDAIDVLLLHPDGTHSEHRLGNDILRGDTPQLVVPAGTWMGGRICIGGRFALFGNTMAPGFTSASFENGERQALCDGWPAASTRITELTRPGSPMRMPDGY